MSGAAVRDILLVPDLAIEHWPSMDRYAAALAQRLPVRVPEEALSLRGQRYLARYLAYPARLARYRPALVHVADHSYAHCLRAFRGVPSVITIHDLYPLHVMREGHPGLRARVRDLLLGRVMRWVKRADRLVAVSRFTAQEAARLLDIDPARIRVAHNGVDDAFFAAPAAPRMTHHAPRTVLHVGSCVPRKNIEGVIAAVAELRRRSRDVRLLQVGGQFTPAQRHLVAQAGLYGAISQEPRASEARLLAAYREADVLLLPSHYEGFGLPVLEALAAGTPVVTSGAGGLAEAAGNVATIVNPPGPAALADAMMKILDGRDAQDARDARRAWARRFTWDATAAAYGKVYDELLGAA